MSPWPAAVAAEPKTLHMLLDADARLAAAAGGVARFLSDGAGLENGALLRWQSAVIEACKNAFTHLLGNQSHLEITFTRFSNRLEVSFSHPHEIGSPDGTPASEHSSDAIGNKGDSTSLPGVDRVQQETHGNQTVTRLTKYFS